MKRTGNANLKTMIAITALLLPAMRAAQAADIGFGTDLASSHWHAVAFPFKTPISTTIINRSTIEITADRAAGMIWHALPEATEAPKSARWSWRVDEGVGPTDLTRKGRDDRAVAIYFIFGRPADREKDVMSLLGSPSVSTLVYVFGGTAPRRTFLDSPHMGARGKFVVLQPADAARKVWLEELVDLEADFKQAFDRAPPQLIGIAISSDSDDTGGLNRVRVRGISTAP